ncbi:MAG: carbohydrate binding domain-containing protein [Melioribacteraceae bacterium]
MSKNGLSKLLKQSFMLTIVMIASCQFTSGQDKFNGGFETKSVFNNDPVSWFATRVPQTKDFVVFARDSTEHHNGSYSVSIEINAKHPEDKIAYNWTRAFEEFKIAHKYELSGWIKTKDLKESAWIVVQFWGENQKWLGMNTNQSMQPVKRTTDWTLVRYDFTVPEGTKEVRIRAGIAAPIDNGGKVWFDDIKIE